MSRCVFHVCERDQEIQEVCACVCVCIHVCVCECLLCVWIQE